MEEFEIQFVEPTSFRYQQKMPSESFREYRVVHMTVLLHPDPINYEYLIASTIHRDVDQLSVTYGYSKCIGFRLQILKSVTEAT